MSTGKEFARGSEWRIWDLHVHTPCSVLNNGFGDDWDKYVQNLFRKAIANNIRAIGVTDYFTIEGYKKLKQEYLQNDTRLKSLFIENEISYINSMLILPNIEFRLNKFVGEKRINFHIIFSDEVPFRDIEENFLRRLEFSMSASPIVCTDKRCLTIENLAELGEKLKSQHEPFRNDSSLKVGMKCATVDDEEISKILTQTHGIFEGKYLICIPSDEDLSSVSWNGQDHLARKLLIQKSHAHFTANPKSIEWALGKMHPSQRDFSNEFGSLRPCFWGSDAHNYDEIFTKNAERKLWIKADLTFEGLKQTTYEPEERVKIQAENPANAFDKLTLRQIEICNSVKVFDAESLEFQKQCIPLNQNLIAIIGGRGTGKSVLVDYIAHGFKQSPNRMNDSIFSQSENFSVTIKRSLAEKDDFVFLFDKQHDVDILFISQNEVKEKTKNHKDLGAEVNRMLGLEKITHTHDMLNEKIKHIRNEYASILEWFEIKDDSDNKINCIEFIEKEACRFKNLGSSSFDVELTDLNQFG